MTMNRADPMLASNTHQNGAMWHWAVVRQESAGQFTARAIGLPEISATAATREEALCRIHEMLRGLLVSGQLVSIDMQSQHPFSNWTPSDPKDPEVQAFLAELARAKQEDLENTLQELDQECSGSSSTRTT